MAHILDINVPSVNPSGAPGGDFEHIEATPEMFGANIGAARQRLGGAIEQAGQVVSDFATTQKKLDDDAHADEVHSWQSDQVTNAQEKFLQLRGKAALDALPQFKQDIDDIHQQARDQAGNSYTSRLIDSQGRHLTDLAYSQAARHAASERSTWDTNTAVEGAASSGSRAALNASMVPSHASINADPNVVLSLARSDDLARQAANYKGLDGDIAAQKNRGHNVYEIIKTTISDGSQTSLKRAWEFLGSQDSRIDAGSRATIETMLRGQTQQYIGQTTADSLMGRGANLPAGYAQRTIHLESGGDPNAAAGSHRGLAQFSPAAEKRYGIDDSNRADAATQARALSLENGENHDALLRALGHEPTPSDYYLAHQQGIGGAVAHLAQPNLPAWQNMASTAEGHDKGAAWAKQAIWGNMTPGMRAQFPGGVDTVTSGDFVRMWAQRFYDQPIQATGATPGMGTGGAPGGIQSVAMPAGINRLQMAQTFANASKGDVLAQVLDYPALKDNPAAMQVAIAHVNKIYESESANYADMERQQHIVEQQRKLVSEAAENDYMKQIYAPTVDAKPLSVAAIVNDDRLNREAKDRIIKLVGHSEEKDDKTYGAGFTHALQMVHAPAGTEGRITDPQQLYSRLGPGGDLTYAGVTKLRDEINLKKTPEGEAETEMKRDFLRNAKSQITGTDEGLHIKDPKGDELYLKFMAQVLPAYDKGRKDGKTPAQLLDPDSPDYVGKIVKNFKRPMDQWFNDTIHDNAPASASGGKAAFDVKTVKSLDDLVTAYRAGNVTKQQADQVAIQNGWAVRKKPAVPSVPVSQ